VDIPAQEPDEEEPIKKLRPSATEFSPTKQPFGSQTVSTSPEVRNLVARAIHQAVNGKVESHPIPVSPAGGADSPADLKTTPQEEVTAVADDRPEPIGHKLVPPAEIPSIPVENTQIASPVDTMEATDAMDAAEDFLGTIDSAAGEDKKEDEELADQPEDQPDVQPDQHQDGQPNDEHQGELQDEHQGELHDELQDEHQDDHWDNKEEDKDDGKEEDKREKKRKAKPIVWNPK